MSKFYLALVAAGLLAASALPAAASGQKAWSGITNSSVSSEQLSAQRAATPTTGPLSRVL